MQFFDVDHENLTSRLNQISQFGGAAAYLSVQGALKRTALGTAVAPAATGADKVLAVYSIPALALNADGVALELRAAGQFANNGNTKQVKIIFNPSTAVVGSTVGSGGTLISDTGASTTSGGVGFLLGGMVVKYGALASNTQWTMNTGSIVGSTHGGVVAPVLATATESAAILVAVTGNATTATTDILLSLFEVRGLN
jgi:hypothetical protein